MNKLREDWILNETVMPSDMNEVGGAVNELDDRAIELETKMPKKAEKDLVYSKEDSNKIYRKKVDKVEWEDIASKPSTYYTHPNDANTRHVTDTEKSNWNGKASTSVVTTSANGLMKKEDKTKLDGIAIGANAYTHPSTHPATIITEDVTHRFTTDIEKSNWNSKASAKALGSNESLDTVNESGIYTNVATANATTANKYPIAEAGSLFSGLAPFSSSNQIYGTFNTNRWFVRGGGKSTTTKTSWAELYSTINKPTASDVGALPILGGNINGNLGVASQITFNNSANQYGRIGWEQSTGDVYISNEVNNFFRLRKDMTIRYGGKKVYSEVEKPTAVDVGARDSNWVPAWKDVTGKPNTFAPIVGTASNQAAAGNHNHNSSYVLVGDAVATATANKVAKLDSNADINVRLLRSNYANQATISGALAFRINNSTDNYTRYCSDIGAIRTFLGALAIDGSNRMTGELKLTGSQGINFNNDDKLIYEDNTNIFKFSSDAATNKSIVQMGKLSIDSQDSLYPQMFAKGSANVGIELNRGENVSYRISNEAGTFKVLNNHADRASMKPLFIVAPQGNANEFRTTGDHCWAGFYRADGKRYGYVGNGSPNNNVMHLTSDIDSVELHPNNFYTRNNGNFNPLSDNAYWLGTNSPQQRWIGMCSMSGVIGGSDAKFKENIIRMNGEQLYFDKDKKCLVESKTKNRVEKATSSEYYEFIKNRFMPTYYDYKAPEFVEDLDGNKKDRNVDIEEETKLLKNIGFIAQDYDLESDKVAQEFIINSGNGDLMYNHMSYVTVGMIALQEAIKKIDRLEEELQLLKESAK